jgi:hypothetical protein
MSITIFSNEDFNDQIQVTEGDDIYSFVAQVFNALQRGVDVAVPVGDKGEVLDRPLKVRLETDGHDAWIVSDEGAAMSRELSSWCEGFAFAVEEAFERNPDLATRRAKRCHLGEPTDVDDEAEDEEDEDREREHEEDDEEEETIYIPPIPPLSSRSPRR